ncbi:MAG: potassium channel family protein [Pyrinomonadaceae bacterium]
MMKWILTAVGFLLIFLVVFEVYMTVLRAHKHPGPVSKKINRWLWWMASNIAHRLSQRVRHSILNSIGPLLLPILTGVLLIFLLVGYALIYYPRLPQDFNISSQTEIIDTWREALYFSGVTLLTIGYGDVTPRTDFMRLMALFEGLSGIAVISLVITYLLTVSSAVQLKRVVALSFFHQAKHGADVAGFIIHYFRRGKFYGLEEIFRTGTRDIQILLESHIEHPVIYYFHSYSVYKSMPRVLFILLEAANIINTCLDQEEYIDTTDHPEIDTLEESALQVLNDFLVALNLELETQNQIETPEEELRRRKRCFYRTMRELKSAGIKTRIDKQIALAEYVFGRERWERQLYRLGYFLGYDWDELTGDNNLQDAVHDEPDELGSPMLENTISPNINGLIKEGERKSENA